MSFGRLGPQGFTRLGNMAQALSAPPRGLSDLPKTNPPAGDVPGDPENVANLSGSNNSLARRLLGDERDSNSRGDERSGYMQGESAPDDLAGRTVVSSEPGAFSMLGLSHGTAFDEAGRGYDTMNFDAGAALGGLAGGLAGPVGGAIGGMAGRQADWNHVLRGARNPNLNVWSDVEPGLFGGQQRAKQEWRDWWNQRNPGAAQARQQAQGAVGTPQLEALLSQAQQQRQAQSERDSQTRGQHGSSTGPGRQTVSGASRNSGFNGRSFGDRGRSI